MVRFLLIGLGFLLFVRSQREDVDEGSISEERSVGETSTSLLILLVLEVLLVFLQLVVLPLLFLQGEDINLNEGFGGNAGASKVKLAIQEQEGDPFRVVEAIIFVVNHASDCSLIAQSDFDKTLASLMVVEEHSISHH